MPPPHLLPTGHNDPLRRGNSVCSCVCRCECLCMCVCVFVWHGWPEECSGSRLAELSQWAGSFTLQGNSTLIRREREKETEEEKPKPSVGNCLKNYTLLSKTVAFFHLYSICIQFASTCFVWVFLTPVNW